MIRSENEFQVGSNIEIRAIARTVYGLVDILEATPRNLLVHFNLSVPQSLVRRVDDEISTDYGQGILGERPRSLAYSTLAGLVHVDLVVAPEPKI
jgi:hypothetical protein